MKLLLENWRKYLAEEAKITVPFYRADAVFSAARLEQLCSAVGKEYVIHRREGEPEYIGTYMSPDRDALMPYASGEAGQTKGQFGAMTELEILEFDGIDEAIFDSNVLPWIDISQQKNQKILKQIFGPGIEKYIEPIIEAQNQFFDPEIADPMFARFFTDEEITVKPGSNKYMEKARKVLGSYTGGLVDAMRHDPELIDYFLTNKNRLEWVEFNFRMHPDGSGTKVKQVAIYDLENGGKEVSCEDALERLNETST
jgi:hypothetical protein